MFVRTDLPPVPIPGRKAPPLVGAMGGVLRFFADPVAAMLDLHRDHGEVAAAVDGNAAIVCAFGAAHNRAVSSQMAAFEHLSEVPIPVRPDSAFARLNNTILFMNGDTHKKRRRRCRPVALDTPIQNHGDEHRGKYNGAQTKQDDQSAEKHEAHSLAL